MKKIRLNETEFNALINECVKKVLKENYPWGAKDDPRAPYNQPDKDWDEIYRDEAEARIDDEIDEFDEKFERFCTENYGGIFDGEDTSNWDEYINNPEIRQAYHEYRFDDMIQEIGEEYNWDDMDDFGFDEDEARYSQERY